MTEVVPVPKTSIYLSSEDYEYLVDVVARMSQKKHRIYTLSQVIKLLIRLLRLIHENGIPDDLGYFLEAKDKEILDLFLTKPRE
ncbi:hypothetical protein DRO54_07325 [Candidatus Bathyarchaeota archaeon]|nr:MAG: hypothetical protein DRO54_07325 [Candidatus Bathyarchaeota archaeon]